MVYLKYIYTIFTFHFYYFTEAVNTYIFESIHYENFKWGFPGGSDNKESARNAGDPGSIPGLGRSPGEGNGCPLQYCLEDSMDRGAWWATAHGVAKNRTRLSD